MKKQNLVYLFIIMKELTNVDSIELNVLDHFLGTKNTDLKFKM